MKRITILALVLSMAAASGAYAAKGTGWAIGGEGSLYFGGSGGLPMGGAVVLHTPYLPILFGVSIDTNASAGVNVGLTGDYWLFHQNLAGIFSWYAGAGGYLGLPNPFVLGLRIPIGLQAWVLGSEFLELFIEAAPALGVRFSGSVFYWHLQGAFGFRFWL